MSSLTEAEENDFTSATFGVVRDVIRELQMEQERKENLMYMKRLEPFLVSMQQFCEVAKAVEVFFRVSYIMAYIWVSLALDVLVRFARKRTNELSQGPMKYVLCVCGADS